MVEKERKRTWPRPGRRPLLVTAVVVAAAAIGAAAVSASGATGATGQPASGRRPMADVGGGSPPAGTSTTTTSTTTTTTTVPANLTVAAITPANGATAVASDATVRVTFNARPEGGGPMPTLDPAVVGSWRASGNALTFVASAPFVPGTRYTLTVPGGASGVAGPGGTHLSADWSASFTIAPGSTLRLQELLAQLGYLPLIYDPPPPPAAKLAMPQAGSLLWRWPALPPQLTSQWVPGKAGPLTRGAVMAFEAQHGLTVDGKAGPEVWTALLADAVSGKQDAWPVTYVLVTKTLPQHLTAWVNGKLAFSQVLVNTGVPGATTADGTFQVFEHLAHTRMRGTDVTGTKYTVPVSWVSYFNGGDALHGYVRATYGWPQSNGCVEMRVTTAKALWPDVPIGTLVTVRG